MKLVHKGKFAILAAIPVLFIIPMISEPVSAAPDSPRIFSRLGHDINDLKNALDSIALYKCSGRPIYEKARQGGLSFSNAPRGSVPGLKRTKCTGPIDVHFLSVDQEVVSITAFFSPHSIAIGGKYPEVSQDLYKRYTSKNFRKFDFMDRSLDKENLFHSECAETGRYNLSIDTIEYYASKERVSSFVFVKRRLVCSSLIDQNGMKEFFLRKEKVRRRLWDGTMGNNEKTVRPGDF